MRLSRYLFFSGHFAATRGRVKWKAFVPKEEDDGFSAFQTEGLDELETWEHSRKHVEPKRQLTTLARGDLLSNTLGAHGLGFKLDNSPPLHGSIGKFPKLKEEREFLAKKLAEAATLVVRPPE